MRLKCDSGFSHLEHRQAMMLMSERMKKIEIQKMTLDSVIRRSTKNAIRNGNPRATKNSFSRASLTLSRSRAFCLISLSGIIAIACISAKSAKILNAERYTLPFCRKVHATFRKVHATFLMMPTFHVLKVSLCMDHNLSLKKFGKL